MNEEVPREGQPPLRKHYQLTSLPMHSSRTIVSTERQFYYSHTAGDDDYIPGSALHNNEVFETPLSREEPKKRRRDAASRSAGVASAPVASTSTARVTEVDISSPPKKKKPTTVVERVNTSSESEMEAPQVDRPAETPVSQSTETPTAPTHKPEAAAPKRGPYKQKKPAGKRCTFLMEAGVRCSYAENWNVTQIKSHWRSEHGVDENYDPRTAWSAVVKVAELDKLKADWKAFNKHRVTQRVIASDSD